MHRFFASSIVIIAVSLSAKAQDFTPAFGCLLDGKKKVKKWAYNPTRGESYPIAYSVRNKFPNIGHQGAYNTCVGWSSSYYAASYLFADSLDYIEEHFSPLFVYNSIKLPSDDNCMRGAYIRSGLEFNRNIGNIKESSWTEDCFAEREGFYPGLENLKQIDPELYTDYRIEASKFRIGDYAEMGPNNFKEKVRKALNEKKAILVAVDFYNSMIKTTYPWNGELDVNRGGHALKLIGYNDTLFGGCYELLNSWGPNYGENGCLYIKYDDMLKILGASYVISAGSSDPFSEDVYLKEQSFSFKLNINGKAAPINFNYNKEIGAFDWSELYVPILHHNEELICNYKARKRDKTQNIEIRLDYIADQNSYVYVFRETMNDYIEKVFPYDASVDNHFIKVTGMRKKFPTDAPIYLRIEEPEPGYPTYDYTKLLIIVSAEPLNEEDLNEQLKRRHTDLRSFAYEAFGRRINYTMGQWRITDEIEAKFEIEELSNVILPAIIDLKPKGRLKEK